MQCVNTLKIWVNDKNRR